MRSLISILILSILTGTAWADLDSLRSEANIAAAAGEAEVASRGFFDTWDRPPPSFWIEVLSRALSRRPGQFEMAILVLIPDAFLARAEAGREVCENGSLRFVGDERSALVDQLSPLLRPLESAPVTVAAWRRIISDPNPVCFEKC